MTKNSRRIIASLLVGIMAANAAAERYFVSPTGNDSSLGTTPASALRTIQAAVNKCTGSGNTIYVAPGTYNEMIEIGIGAGVDASSGTADSPNRIIGDFSGVFTGSAPGQVTISGGDVQQYGVRIQARSWWEFYNLSLADQTNYGIFGYLTTGVMINNCAFDVPTSFAVYLLGGGDYTIDQCDFNRGSDSGHCVWIFPYRNVVPGAYVRIRRNNFAMKGGLFMSTPYRENQIPMNGRRRVYSYGLIVFNWAWASNQRGLDEAVVENNVFSDFYLPMLVITYRKDGGATDVRVSNNSIVGCTYSIYSYAAGATRPVLSNNFASDCYFSPYFANTDVHGILLNGIRREQNSNWIRNSTIEGQITDEDPMLTDPANGDWSPREGSPLIDAGFADGAPNVDYLGNDRPYDGDRDGTSDYDIGAVEFGSSQSVFVDVSADTGFNLPNRSGVHRGSGLHWGDLDNDGDLDAVVTGVGSAVLINNGQTFSAYALADGQAWRQGALLDADADGDLDFYISCDSSFNDETLFINDGTGSFTDGGDAGFVAASNNEGLAAADLDADGSADLVLFSENGNWRGINTTNNGAIDFDATNDAGDGLAEANLAGNGDFVSAADVNDDGYLDFFYNYANGRLFVSDGRGGFNADDSAITVATGNGIKFGSAWGDFDNDGDMDLFTPSRSSGTRGALFEDNGSAYVNIAGSAGVTNSTVQYSAAWGDYDNDGDLDLLIATGARAPIALYANNGDGSFSEADDGPTIDGLVQDVVFVDYDNDGDLDIAATRPGATNVLMQNTLDNNAFLKARAVYLTSAGVPVDVIGARIELLDQAGTLLARREVGVARGYGGTEPTWAHFGGVDPAETYTVRVTWPGGSTTSAQVVPGEASTTIGGRNIPQMITMTKDFPAAVRVVNWREISPADR